MGKGIQHGAFRQLKPRDAAGLEISQMPILVWSEEYSINVAEIDAQHKKLLEFVNKLHAGVAAEIDREELRGLFEDLVEYTRFHFESEEKLMAEHGMATLTGLEPVEAPTNRSPVVSEWHSPKIMDRDR